MEKLKRALLESTKPIAVYGGVPVGDRWGLAVVVENEAGYHETDFDTYATEAEAKAAADRWNEQLGLTVERATMIVASSMRAQNEGHRLSRDEPTPPSPYQMTGLGWGDPAERRRKERKPS